VIYEKQFREFEGKAARVIQRIIATRAMPTDEEALSIPYNFICLPICADAQCASVRRTKGTGGTDHPSTFSRTIHKLYESEIRRNGGDLNGFPFERIQQPKGMYDPCLTTDGFRR
jgi:hypothetical protein